MKNILISLLVSLVTLADARGSEALILSRDRKGAVLRSSLLALAQEPPVVRTTTNEVILDVVIRDKKGRPIKDLTGSEVNVFDNGQKQKILSFRLVEGREAIEQGAKVALDPLRQVRLVTLIFERLSPEARRIARQAALDLIAGDQAQNVFYSVFAIETQLYGLQNFTADKDALKKAIEKATSGQYAIYATEANQLKARLDQANNNLSQLSSPTPGANAGATAVENKLAEVMAAMMRFDQATGQGESTRRSIFALLSLVRGQHSMPGRKSVLYFSEGLWIPPHLDEPFRSVMSTANRGNVSFYAIDTRGVMTNSQNADAVEQMRRAARASAADITSQGGPVSKEAIFASDAAETSSRNNVQLPLRDLSQSTGGFLIGDTNDLRGPLRRINEEVNVYYELAYNPGISTFDGAFRKTAVEVSRKDIVVHARNGYFALPADIRGVALLPYEMPLLKALDLKPLPRDVEFRSADLRFDRSTSLVMEVPFGGVQFTEDKQKNTYKARLSVMALVKDSNGEVLQKFSRDLPLGGPAAQIPRVKMGNFIYKEQISLPPGRYTVETAVIDHESGKTAAKKAALVVQPRLAGVALSGLTVVRTYQPDAKDLDASEPFQFQGGRITPALSATISNGAGAQLSTFMVIYPDPAIDAKPQLVIEYLLDGKPVGRGEVPLPAADASGKIPFVMSAPAEKMLPGSYEVRAIVKQGNTTADERTFVTVVAGPQ